ncbi:MAG: hypothetical protein JSR46_03055, partial [Verrucomicrobia bacterium]|nr:hypothetical protein [Verrucomicrobiota bacterium]
MSSGLTRGEIEAMLRSVENVEASFDAVAGATMAVEVRMRLIGELSALVRRELATIVARENAKLRAGKKRATLSDKYWDCKLEYLEEAIDQAYGSMLDQQEQQKFLEFRKLRNKLFHGNFVELMKLLNTRPTGREQLGGQSARVVLRDDEIREAVLSIERNNG